MQTIRVSSRRVWPSGLLVLLRSSRSPASVQLAREPVVVAVLVDVAVVVPAVVLEEEVVRSGVGVDQVAGQNAGVAEVGAAVAGLVAV